MKAELVKLHIFTFLYMVTVYFTGAFRFMIWNVFLAMAALDLSVLFVFLKNRKAPLLLLLAIFGVWLLFYPNTFYMITDLMHMDWIALHIDLRILRHLALFLILVAGVFLGVRLGICSVHLMKFGLFSTPVTREAFVLGLSALSSVGIYLGRFLRFNSWDLFTNPILVLQSCLEVINLSFLVFVFGFSGIQVLVIHLFSLPKPQSPDEIRFS
ncbi:MAG: DUF1361 domain-containing protein [Erysipelotrichaceae bacterium]|jgi:uncharacterized membrane protein|nr:DUF1361 domain-containing protein [Erysipelotrichaceae bacterium]